MKGKKIGRNNVEGGGKGQMGEERMRDEEVVRGLLNVKLGQVNREERQIRKQYKEEWTRAESWVSKNSPDWRRLKREVGSKMEERRKRERGRLEKKKEYLVKKYSKMEKVKNVESERDLEVEREILEGVRLTDRELGKMTQELGWSNKPVIYGELENPLDKDEEYTATQDPKRAIYGKIDLKKMRREREVCNTKLRYERLFNPVEDQKLLDEEMTGEEMQRVELQEMWQERCHNEQEGSVAVPKRTM